MRRREVLALAAALGAWPLAGHGQQAAKVARIGLLGATSAASWGSQMAALQSGLRDLGYVLGKNILIEARWAEDQYDLLPTLASELVGLGVDLLAAKGATTDLPIVFVYSGDAVAAGLVTSLTRPGGNVTGSTYFLPQLMAKRLELLKEAMPHITRVAVLVKADNPLFMSTLPVMQSAANSLSIELHRFDAHSPSEFESAFAAMHERRIEAILFQEDGVFLGSLKAIADLAARRSLPFVGSRDFAEAGALIGYGVDFRDMCRRAAVFVDKIVRGGKPADIPVEQATKFETVLNIRSAKSLGIPVATSLLLRANRVIE
jgi:putative ABC transport system substrate-binding protein